MSSSLCFNTMRHWTDGCVRRSSVAVVPGQAHASYSQETARSQRRGRAVGAGVVVNAVAKDGVIEGIEDPRLPFCIGVQWHPEFRITEGDRNLFKALVAAAAK